MSLEGSARLGTQDGQGSAVGGISIAKSIQSRAEVVLIRAMARSAMTCARVFVGV
jgi:hypothetical protein